MGNKKKWSRTTLRKEFMGFGLKFNLEKSPNYVNKIYRNDVLIMELTDTILRVFGDVRMEIPISMIDTLKVKENYPFMIIRLFLLREQYLEFELMLLDTLEDLEKDEYNDLEDYEIIKPVETKNESSDNTSKN